MVKEVASTSTRNTCILLAPNQSLSLAGNLWVFISLVAVSLGISIAFALAGAWMVLPFAGLEMLLLGILFGYVYLEGTRREVISISDERVVLDRCRGSLQKSVYHQEFSRENLRVKVRMPSNSGEPAIVSFSGPEGCLEIGEFLTDEERAALIQKLGSCGICASKEQCYKSQEF